MKWCMSAEIYDKVSEELEKDGLLDCECVGGGRIRHDAQAKKIHVYGYSMVSVQFSSNSVYFPRASDSVCGVFSLTGFRKSKPRNNH